MLFLATCATSSWAGLLDLTGVNLLRQTTTNLNGTGIIVAQPEASSGGALPDFEVNPGNSTVNQPKSLFTYHSDSGTATNYPNSAGIQSGHANGVASFFYGLPGGVATNIGHVDNYDANYFINSIISPAQDIPARIVNQSFIAPTNGQESIDTLYDNYSASRGVLFVSGVGNGGVVYPPSTCYNGIGVAAYGTVNSSIGPTLDGRCKPDITAPQEGANLVTSFTTPLVSGSAAVLLQAGLRGDGGSDTNAASDMRTLKALLLNGAIKPNGWTNGTSTPLDARHGAGMVNLFNSYRQFVGGQHAAIEQTSVSTNAAHPPGANEGNISQWSGWSFGSISSTSTPPPGKDTINHHYFNLTNSGSPGPFTATVTLVWNRQNGQTAINNLNLFLYNTANSNLIAQSISRADNVEHLYVRELPQGRYDLQVWKAGGTSINGRVTSSETYALAWEFFTMPLAVSQSDTNLVLSWPIYPTGFVVESTPSLSAPSWTTIVASPPVIDGTNPLTLPASANQKFFRLRRPAF